MQSLIRWLLNRFTANPLTALQGQLNDAIRAGDVPTAKHYLEAGASLSGCTLDQDGYHTPSELARNYKNNEMVVLIDRYGQRIGTRLP
jgi:hypothetical protein